MKLDEPEVGTSSNKSADDTVTEMLDRCRRLVEPALREVVGQLHPWPGHMASFAFGWCEPDGTPRDAPAGKGVRPALAVLCAEGHGAPAEAAISGAVSVELIHAFSLVHDDIMDGDERRRHRPTLWKAYGTGPAVLAGDALLAQAIAVSARSAVPSWTTSGMPGMAGMVGAAGVAGAVGMPGIPGMPGAPVMAGLNGPAGGGPASPPVADVLGFLSASLVDLVNGQAADVSFESRPWTGPERVSVEEYCRMAAGKTGALLACAAAAGTVLGGGSRAAADDMWRMGHHLGLAFQAVDDLLGIWGDPGVTGKPVWNDLRQAKKTLPVVAALEAGSAPAAELTELLAAGPDDHLSLRRTAELIEAAGGRAAAQRLAGLHLRLALDIIDGAGLAPTAAAELAALARFVVDRDT